MSVKWRLEQLALESQKPVSSVININTVIYAIPVLVVFALGLTSLYFPFGPDQASMFTGAISLNDGGALYLDYWDNKQPGLFWFYALAGWMFGYTEFGIHLFELIWLLSLCLLLVWFLRRVLNIKLLATLAPIACVATYYASATEFELAQLEILVSFPIMFGIVCLIKADSATKNCALLWFLSGLCAGVLISFKLILGAIFIGLWAWSIWVDWRSGATWKQMLYFRILPAFLGAGLVILCLMFWFYHQGTLSQFIWTSFVYPPLALQSSPAASYTRIFTALVFFAEFTLIWLPFAGYSMFKFVWGKKSKFTGLVMVWLSISVVLFLIQNFSWWHYHTLLFFVPFGLLGVIGLDYLVKDIFQAWTNTQMTVAVFIFIMCAVSPLFSPFVERTEMLIHHKFISKLGVQGYQAETSDMFRRQWKTSQFLKHKSSLPGPIYVLGNPMIYQYSGREVPHSIVGSSWEFYLPEQINHIKSTLRDKQVPYLFVGVEDYKVFQLNRALKMLIVADYNLLKEDDAGRWYINKNLKQNN